MSVKDFKHYEPRRTKEDLLRQVSEKFPLGFKVALIVLHRDTDPKRNIYIWRGLPENASAAQEFFQGLIESLNLSLNAEGHKIAFDFEFNSIRPCGQA